MKIKDVKKEINMSEIMENAMTGKTSVITDIPVDEQNEYNDIEDVEDTQDTQDTQDIQDNEDTQDTEEVITPSSKRIIKWRGEDVEISDDQIDTLLSKGLEMDNYKKENARDVNIMQSIRNNPDLSDKFNELLFNSYTGVEEPLSKKEEPSYDGDGFLYKNEVEETINPMIDPLSKKINSLENQLEEQKLNKYIDNMETSLNSTQLNKFNEIIDYVINSNPELEISLGRNYKKQHDFYKNIYETYFANDTSEPVSNKTTNSKRNDTSEPVSKKNPFIQKSSTVVSNNSNSSSKDKDILNMSMTEFNSKVKPNLNWTDLIKNGFNN